MNRFRQTEDLRSGQAILFLMMVVVILGFVMLWNFDLHKTLFVKSKTRNAGDAAALSAARWQGKSLNAIGDLNLAQAVIVSDAILSGRTKFPELAAISDLRSRIGMVGPMLAFSAAQQAAKNNGIYNNARYAQEILEHADHVSLEYNLTYTPPYEPSSDGSSAWDEYADMMRTIALNGLAVWPENIKYYQQYADLHHYLLNPNFYDAVGSHDWCWFHFHARNLLEKYANWEDWGELPQLVRRNSKNSEIFSLGVRTRSDLVGLPVFWTEEGMLDDEEIDNFKDLISDLADRELEEEIIYLPVDWQIYDAHTWRSWKDYLGDGFPFRAPIKEEYDYVGADAAVLLQSETDRLTPDSRSAAISWTAAAKPFGSLEEGGLPPNHYGLVLPSFEQVRLIPVDASSAPAGQSGTGWATHIYEHLPEYMERGPDGLSGACQYCAVLKAWGNVNLRESGLQWLAEFSDSCYGSGGSGSGGDSGGARRGH